MSKLKRAFISNLAVSILGIIVGIDNLFRWYYESYHVRNLILGLVCTICAVIWLVYIFISKND